MHEAARAPAICHGEPLCLHDAPRTLGEALTRASQQRPARGIVYLEREGRESSCSYAGLWADASRIAGGLAARGVRRGGHALLVIDEERDLVSAFWGCVLAGVVAVPASLAHEAQAVERDARIVECWRLLDGPPLIASRRATSRLLALWEQAHLPAPSLLSVTELVGHRLVGECAASPDDVTLLLLTSGSTGAPKLVTHTHRTVLSLCAATVQANGFTKDEISLNWFPLDHVGGLVMFHLRDVYLGCRQVQAPIDLVLREPLRWLDWIERFRATVTWAPNFAYALVVSRAADLALRRRELSSMRFILNGGEAIVARQARRFLSLLAPHGLAPDAMHPAWGMSETCSGVTYSQSFSLASSDDADVHVEVGSPLPGTSLRIVDEEGRLLSEGEVGLLEVRGPSLTPGYHRNPTATAEVFSTDGWLRTGDIGFLRDGRLTVTGREKDAVIVAGANHSGHQIEAVVESVSGVAPASAVAIGVRTREDPTDRLAIFFVPQRGYEAVVETIGAHIRERLTVEVGLAPRYVVPLAASDVPRTVIGKVQRRLLRERFERSLLACVPEAASTTSGPSSDVPTRVRRVVARVLQVSPDALSDADALEDVVPLDSLSLVEVVSAIEEELVVRIRGDELKEHVALQDLIDAAALALAHEANPPR